MPFSSHAKICRRPVGHRVFCSPGPISRNSVGPTVCAIRVHGRRGGTVRLQRLGEQGAFGKEGFKTIAHSRVGMGNCYYCAPWDYLSNGCARGFHATEGNSSIPGRRSRRPDCDQCSPQHEHRPSPKRLYLQLSPPARISASPPTATIIIPAPAISRHQSPSHRPSSDRSLRLQRFRLI